MSVTAVMSASAFADISIVTVSNGHGQSRQLYRNSDTSVALYAAGAAAGAADPILAMPKLDTIDKVIISQCISIASATCKILVH